MYFVCATKPYWHSVFSFVKSMIRLKYIFLVMKDKEAESSAQVSKKKPSSLGEQNQ